MTNQDCADLCAGFNHNMTQEQMSIFLKELADSMESENKDAIRLLHKFSDLTSDEVIREIILELSLIEVIRGTHWRLRHTLAYGEYPTAHADSTSS